MMNRELDNTIDALAPEMVQALCGLIERPSVPPADGGTGEGAKAAFIAELLKKLELPEPAYHDATDDLGNIRPNMVVHIPGKSQQRLWFISHMDVVPEGERSMWDTDPFKGCVKDGKVYGRGSTDNCQDLVSSIYAACALHRMGIKPELDVYLCFVADEELGSRYGIQHLIKEGLFRPDDLIVVPDAGNEDGSFIEVAEKTMYRIEFTVTGRQVHASTPQLGLNACRVANELSVALDSAFHASYPEEDKLFDPSVSTFEPTRRRANVPNINTVPGTEVFCFDCRLLPPVNLDEMDRLVENEIRLVSEKHKGVKIEWRHVDRGLVSEPTSLDSPVVKALTKAACDVYGVTVKSGGIGGGTCAAFFRQQGIPAAVWGQKNDTAHMPNEYAEILHMVNEAKVFARMMAAL